MILNPRSESNLEGVHPDLVKVVRRAAERMQGTAGIESSEGAGSTFYVELPRAEAP